MTLSNDKVADMFANGRNSGESNRMVIRERTIYSYGRHFPIAIRLNDHIAVFNVDKYSSTTSGHQGRVREALRFNGWNIKDVDTDTIKTIDNKGYTDIGQYAVDLL